MLRYLCWISFLSVIVLTILTLIMRAAGSLLPAQPVIAGLDQACEDKPQPCWYGVILGKTTVNEVEAVFKPLGDNISDNIAKGQLEIFKTTLGG
jgi:hypothetical protein